jgi:hypothetical protein
MILRNGTDTENIICNLPHCNNREYDLCRQCKKSLCLHCIKKLLYNFVIKCPFCRLNGNYSGYEKHMLIENILK